MEILGQPSKLGATENADSIELKFKAGLTWKFLPSTSEYMKSFVLAKMNHDTIIQKYYQHAWICEK